MATLLEQLGNLSGGASLSGDIAGAAGQFADIGRALRAVMQNPPGDFAGLLGSLDSLPLPQLSLAGDLTAGLGGVATQLEGALSGGAGPLGAALSGLRGNVTEGLAQALGPLLEIIGAVRTLLATDLSCGLVPALAPPAVAAPPPTPQPGDPPPPPAPPATPPAPVLSDAQVNAAKALVDALPADTSAPALLKWLHERIGVGEPGGFVQLRAIPLLDDLRDPLDTLVRWDAADGSALLAEYTATLGTLTALVTAATRGPIGAALPAPAIAALPAAAFGTVAQQLGDALAALDAAARAADTGALAAAIGPAQAAQAALEARNAELDAAQASLDTLRTGLAGLPGALEAGICRLLVLLAPPPSFADLTAPFGPILPDAVDSEIFAPVADLFTGVRQALERLLGALDVGAVTGPITAVLDQVRSAIQAVEQGIAQLTATARAAFTQAQDALDIFDPDALEAQARAALEQAVQALGEAITAALGPAGAALTNAIGTAQGALGTFDPEALAAPVQAVVDELSALLGGPEVQALRDALKQLKALAQQLDTLSFAPVGDEVIAGIGTVTSALESIDDANLTPPMPDMIAAAMSVLPPSLTPIIQPLLGELDDLIAQGPGDVLDGLRELPQRIADALAAYSPRALLEEPLGAPFAALTGELDDFSPTAWLDGADAALADALGRLAGALDPAALLAPLAQAYQTLTDQLGGLRPGALLEPLTAQLEDALKSLDTALPTEEITQALAQVSAQVQRLLAPLHQVSEVIGAWTTKLAQIADPQAALSAWLDAILAKLPADAPATLAAALAAVGTAVDGTGAAALGAAWDGARAPLDAALTAADAPARLARLVQLRSSLGSALAALPDSPAKASAQAFVAGCDILGPLGRGLTAIAQLGDASARARSEVAALLKDWDARYRGADGALRTLVPPALTTDALRAQLRTAIERQLAAPVLGLFKAMRLLGALVASFGETLTDLMDAIETKLAAVLAAPQALADAARTLDELADRLTGLDLDLYAREVDGLHAALMDKLRALDPATLGDRLRDALTDLLGDITLGAVFTPALRKQLDDAWAQLKAQVAALDPEPLVIAPLQQVYEQDLLPVVQDFDVSDALQAVLDKLGALPDELGTELGRVDAAYQAMLAAAPSGGPGGGGAAVGF